MNYEKKLLLIFGLSCFACGYSIDLLIEKYIVFGLTINTVIYTLVASFLFISSYKIGSKLMSKLK